MEPISAGVGLAASVYSLLEAAKALHKSIKRLQLNGQRRKHLQTLVDGLIEVLKSVGSMSDPAAVFAFSSLQEIKSILESLAEAGNRHRLVNSVLMCIGAPDVEAKLDAAERKLENLRTEVVVVAGVLQLKEQIPTICNARMELPQSCVGLDRAKAISEFLQRSKSEELRVIGIHGLGGVGKTTLLNYVWQEVSSKTPFAERAYVQIGHDATAQSLSGLQSSMLQQLGGGRKEFSSCETGKRQLSEHFQQLRSNKKPVFLAIDNIFRVEDLEKLLPFNLSKDLLPAFSCIAVTCRNFGVVKALLNICNLQEKNSSQVFCFHPPCLNPEESKAVFAECSRMDAAEHEELLDALVPLCGGLPLALTILGKIFVDEAKRERREWEDIKKQMQVLDGNDEETSPVTKSLQISYDILNSTRQAAFLDVVNFFYGWSWERVERILGVNVLKELKNSSLISDADDWTKCNQSALKTGFLLSGTGFQLRSSGFERRVLHSMERVVTMHDLTLRFGESLRGLSHKVTIRDFPSKDALQNHHHLNDAPKFRNLILCGEHESDSNLEFLEMATNLQMLLLREGKSIKIESNLTNSDFPQHLRFLRLEGSKSSWRIMETKLSCEIREIHLHRCQDVVQLPDTPLQQLEYLHIFKCQNFQGFSHLCVKQWDSLKYLSVVWCNNITIVPAELGYLKNLKSVKFIMCSSLEDFPPLCNSNGPSHLVIEGCSRLRTLPAMSCPLQRLELEDIPIDNLVLEEIACVFLQVVSLHHCNFEVLPDEVGKLTSLTELDVSECKHLKGLPSAIGNASSLQTLSVRGCESLVELPDELGKLTSLTELKVSRCKHLKGLPSTIGNASSLQTLDVSGCESLVELPDEVGKLTSLTKLKVSRCKHLKGLPSAIGNASSLQTLDVNGCESLVELPDEVGKLTSLTKLDASWCKHLKGLPSAIVNASSLQTLDVSGCESLVELADEVGKLTSLTKLDFSWYLKGPPSAIGNALSFQALDVKAWQSCQMRWEMVQALKGLPSAIGNASSLQALNVSECDSLVELPEEGRKLTSLT